MYAKVMFETLRNARVTVSVAVVFSLPLPVGFVILTSIMVTKTAERMEMNAVIRQYVLVWS